jgi:hypothetical protein
VSSLRPSGSRIGSSIVGSVLLFHLDTDRIALIPHFKIKHTRTAVYSDPAEMLVQSRSIMGATLNYVARQLQFSIQLATILIL